MTEAGGLFDESCCDQSRWSLDGDIIMVTEVGGVFHGRCDSSSSFPS